MNKLTCNFQSNGCSLRKDCEFNFEGNISSLITEADKCEGCKTDYSDYLICLQEKSDESNYDTCHSTYNLKCGKANNVNCYQEMLNKWKGNNQTIHVISNMNKNTNPGFICNDCTKQVVLENELLDLMGMNSSLVKYSTESCGSTFLYSTTKTDPNLWKLTYIIGGFISFFLLIIIAIFIYNNKVKQPEKDSQPNSSQLSLLDTSGYDVRTRRMSLFPSLNRSESTNSKEAFASKKVEEAEQSK